MYIRFFGTPMQKPNCKTEMYPASSFLSSCCFHIKENAFDFKGNVILIFIISTFP